MTASDESFWGWGHADRFPPRERRRELADRLEDELGFPDLTVEDPPDVEDVALPAPAVEPPPDLSAATTDRRARIDHTYGSAYRDLLRGFRGDFSPAPDVVARPESEDEVAAVLAWAGDTDVAVIPYGGGTSVVGGVEADLPDAGGGGGDGGSGGSGGAGESEEDDGGGGSDGDGRGDYAGVCSLDLRSMDRVLAVDEESRTARIQAGATGPRINEQLAEYGLQLRHYPQSYEFSTLGGWIATRAGGHFATRYTRIDDFVQSVRAVTPAGTIETRPVPSSGAGPDPNRFLLGSEGAFGAITEARVRVQPRPPYRSRASVRFADFDAAVRATRRVVQARLTPANCRLLDRNEAALNDVATDGSHVLVLGFESVDGPVEADLRRAVEICEEEGGRVPDDPTHRGPDRDGGSGDDGDAEGPDQGGDGEGPDRDGDDEGPDRDGESGDDADDWRSAFFEGPYLFNQLVSAGVIVDTFETAVTWDRLADLHGAVRANVTEAMVEACGTGFLTTRFTHVYPDGPAVYYTLLAPGERGRELEQWRRIKTAATGTVQDHGGTVTHHHATGRLHREAYDRETPELYRRALRAMKRTLDPEGIMNPGVLVDPDR